MIYKNENSTIIFVLINIVGNTLLFVPIGICIPLLWNISYGKVMLIGFLYTLFIELTQMFMPRVSDVDDLILNSFGVFIGILIHKCLIKTCLKKQ
ncbi:MAG: VanZ family protein [Lachnospiraceae bacterium]|nr:VanZ family protein [Lachnospiraceae bacterium]